MTTVLLVRHGLTTATGTTLSGHTPGCCLDERGLAQAADLARRLRPVPLDAVVTSPLERCQQTAAALLAGRDGLTAQIDERVVEVRYGDWTGRPLAELAHDPLWKVVQHHPSAAVFPGEDGEALAGTQARAVAAVRDWNARLGPDAVYAVCSHGDVIKSILADALGLHLDQFQRIVVNPCSVSVVVYTDTRPFVVRVNDNGGSVADLLPDRAAPATGDAVVGGGSGGTA